MPSGWPREARLLKTRRGLQAHPPNGEAHALKNVAGVFVITKNGGNWSEMKMTMGDG